MKRKWIRYIARTIVACISIWIILLLTAFFYIQGNKQGIIAIIRSDIDHKISGKIAFSDLSIDFFQNFPGISVDFKNVYIQDSLLRASKEPLFRARDLYVGFGILDLIAGRKTPEYLTVSNGRIYFFVDSFGNKNWNILKEKSEKKVNLKKVGLKNIEAIFQDMGKNKFFDIWFENMECRIYSNNNRVRFKMNNSAVIKSAAFNTKAGSYLANKTLKSKAEIVYDKKTKKISLQNQGVKINGQSYQLTGNFFLADAPYFNLNISTTSLMLKEAASIFPAAPKKMISQFKLSKPLYKVRAYLSGPMKYLSFPVAKIYFSAREASLDVSPARFEHLGFNAFFENQTDSSRPPGDSNSTIQFSNVKGDWENNSFDAKRIFICNLVHPYLKCDVHFLFKLAQLQKAIASRRLDLNGGKGEAMLDYEGPLTKANSVYHLNGIVTIKDGDITYDPRRLTFKRTDMELSFQNGDMVVKKMNTEINEDPVTIRGRVRDFLNFFNTDSSKADFEWTIYSPHLDIGKLRSSLHRNTVEKKKSGYSFFERLNARIDRLFDDCNAYLNIKADKIVYKNFSAKDVNGELTLRNDMIGLDHFSFLHAGGSITVTAFSKDNGTKSDLILQSKLQNVNIQELFSAFNNFGLESLTSKNISGSFSGDVHLTSMLDANYDLYKPANRGYINFSLKNGQLVNFQPLMEIDNNFLQRRDLSHVSFAELKDRFDILGNDIKINRMEIRSTAINMYMEGVYSFAGNTDLSIQIPLHGQKKTSEVVPGNRGNNSKGGISVFLRAKDRKDGKLKISYDLLGRFRSKK